VHNTRNVWQSLGIIVSPSSDYVALSCLLFTRLVIVALLSLSLWCTIYSTFTIGLSHKHQSVDI